MRKNTKGLLVIGALLLSSAACSEEFSTPTADAGSDQVVQTGQVVQIDGSDSADKDGLPLTFRWAFVELPAGSTASLNDDDIVNPSFRADARGDYVIALVVSNGVLTSDEATVTITAGPCGLQAPVVQAIESSPTAPGVGVSVQMEAAVIDPDLGADCGGEGEGLVTPGAGGEPVAYRWRLLGKPTGSQASLNDEAVHNPSIVPDVAGDYVLELAVTDADGLTSAPVTHTVTASVCGGQAPSVGALSATPSEPDLGDLVRLDAEVSDADNEAPCELGQGLRFEWAFEAVPTGSAARINDPGVSSPSFTPDVAGVYVVRLVMTDDTGLRSAPATVTIQTSDCHTAAPVIDAISANPAAPNSGQIVQLGADVSDADVGRGGCAEDGRLSFSWRLVGLPPGSRAALNNGGASNPSFLADLPGDYVVDLVVTDAFGLPSAVATETITASVCGSSPPTGSVAATPQAPITGQTVLLEASASDADAIEPCELPQSFTWDWTFIAVPQGSAARFNAPTSRTPSFLADTPGAYVVRMVVTDADGHSGAPVVTAINVDPCGSNAPVIERVDVNPGAPATDALVTLLPTVSDDDNRGCGLNQSHAFAWRFLSVPSDSAAAFNNDAVRSPSFVPDVPGDYALELVVTDDTGRQSAATALTIAVSDCGSFAPVVDQIVAAPSDSPLTGQAVTLTFLATDGDNDPLGCDLAQRASAAWAFVDLPPGSSATLNDATIDSPTFTPDVPGAYVLELVVTDDTGRQSAASRVTVIAQDCGAASPSIAAETFTTSPTQAQTIVGEPISLSVVATDADNDQGCDAGQTLRYAWQVVRLPSGSRASLNDASLASPSFTPDLPGAYAFALRVIDSTGRVDAAGPFTIDVVDCGGHAPVADIKITSPGLDETSPANVGDGTIVQVDAIDSFDVDVEDCGLDQELFFQWQLLVAPVRSEARLSSPSARNPWFEADVEGVYVVRLFVSDGLRISSAVEFTIIAN